MIQPFKGVIQFTFSIRTMSKYSSGDHVKVEFADERSGESEWMWVKVDHSDDERKIVFGRLDSQPIISTEPKVGQELAVSYDKIRDHRRFHES
jgi:uncharacterized protein YegJ (DUF2314 family)